METYSFGEWLQQRRKQLRLTQKEVGAAALCSAAMIRKIEADERIPSLELAQLLAEAVAVAPGQYEIFVACARRERPLADLLAALENSEGEMDEGKSTDKKVIPHNLPVPPTPFIGRQAELTALNELMANPALRLVTIVGPGGMGKTRLGLAVAEQWITPRRDAPPARLPNDFPNGIFFVNLAPLSEVDYMVTAVADALNFPLQGQDSRSPLQQLLDYLRQKKMLLLFDNFEHLLDGVDILVDILQAAPEVQILVTSRERLHLRMEQVYPIEGLEFPDWETLQDAEEYTAVQLFLQSARRNQPDFALHDGDDLTYLARICRTVAGMPLALELAASWVDMLPLAEIASELQQGLDLLETNMHDMPERHRSVRAAIDYSWQKLDETEREIFAKLSVFRGGFTREAAKAVADANLRQLARLVGKSLLQGGGKRGDGRYQVHELLHQYGAEKLERAGHYQKARAAYTEYFLKFVHNREADVKGHRQLTAVAEIKTEFEAICTAWSWAIEDEKFQLIDQAISCLAIFSSRDYHIAAYKKLWQQAMATLTPALDEEPSPVWVSLASQPLGPDHREINLLERALSHSRQQGDLTKILHSLTALVSASFHTTGNYEHMLPLIKEGLTLAHQLDDRFQIANLKRTQGLYYQSVGQMDKAIQVFQQVLTLMKAMGDELGTATVQQNYAELMLWHVGDFARAQADYSRVVIFYKQIANQHAVAWNETYLGFFSFLNGEFAEAGRVAQIAWDDYYKDTNAGYVVLIQFFIGLSAIGQSNYYDAVNLYKPGAHYGYGLMGEFSFLNAWGLTMALYGLGEFDSAKKELFTAIAVTLTPPQKGMMKLVLPVAALLMAQEGMSKKAIELLALSYKHLMGMTGWLEKATMFSDLHSKLEAAYGADEFAASWQRGQAADLVATVESLLIELTELGWGEETGGQMSKGTEVQGRFRQKELIATGGYGEVYRGEDTETEQVVVIKRLKPELVTRQPDVVARFVREGELLRQLNHPNIVQMLATETIQFGEESEGDQCLIMEYVAGGSLRDLLDKEGWLSVARTVAIALELADALSRAHHLDIIHRDLKPGNVLLAEDGTPRLTDFGIARMMQREGTQLTQDGAMVGTVDYMSPEACRGEVLDGRSDIWSFGILLYEMLTGKLPFQREHITATIFAVLDEPTPALLTLRSDVPPALVRLIEGMLVKDREGRNGRMRQVAAELDRIRDTIQL